MGTDLAIRPLADRAAVGPGPDRSTVRLLADGRLDRVAERVVRLRATDPLLAEVVAADAAARRAEAGLAELRDLEERLAAEAPDRPLLRWWAVAMLGERAFLDADLGAIPLAVQTLADVPDQPYAGVPLLYVRGRLRRIAAAVYLLAPSAESMAGHARLRDAAVADFLRADLTAEAALTRGLAAALHAVATWEDVPDDLAVVRDARDQLGGLEGSVWVPLLDHLMGAVALAAGDLATAAAAAAAVERHRHLHPVVAALADVGRAELALVASGGTGPGATAAADDLVASLGRLRHRHPHLLGLCQLRAANLLADVGRAGAARAIGTSALAWPPPNEVIQLAGELLRVRLDVLDGPAPVPAGALGLLERMEGLGHRRRAGATAVRMAGDWSRAGDPTAAGTVRTWGLARLPAPPRRTPCEERWASVPAAADSSARRPFCEDQADQAGPSLAMWSSPLTPAPAVPAPSTVVVRVLAPVLDVRVDGEPVALRATPGKLLVALVEAHPDPLHVEQAVDLLWPDAPPGVGRDRLNTVVHRLRTALAAGGPVVRRTGDVLVLWPDGWAVDLLGLRAAAPGDRSLLTRVTGNLCQVQFPYDDHLVDRRRVVAADLARALGHVDAAGPDPALDRVRALVATDARVG